MCSDSRRAASAGLLLALLTLLVPTVSQATEVPLASVNCTTSSESAFIARSQEFARLYQFEVQVSSSAGTVTIWSTDMMILVTHPGSGSYSAQVFRGSPSEPLADSKLWHAIHSFRRSVAPVATCALQQDQ